MQGVLFKKFKMTSTDRLIIGANFLTSFTIVVIMRNSIGKCCYDGHKPLVPNIQKINKFLHIILDFLLFHLIIAKRGGQIYAIRNQS